MQFKISLFLAVATAILALGTASKRNPQNPPLGNTGAMADIMSEFAPLPNVLLGTSIGNDDAAAWRRAPMSFLSGLGWRTWVSYEPAIGPVDWTTRVDTDHDA